MTRLDSIKKNVQEKVQQEKEAQQQGKEVQNQSQQDLLSLSKEVESTNNEAFLKEISALFEKFGTGPMDEKKKKEFNEELDDLLEQHGVGPITTGPVISNVEMLDLTDLKVFGRWKIPAIDKQDIVSGVNGLSDPYKTEISDFIKKNDVKWLQVYLNEKIKDGSINSQGLKEALTKKGISFWNNQILEDGKFGPQTLETLKFFIQLNQIIEKPQTDRDLIKKPIEKPIDSPEKEKWWTNWIAEEISGQITEIKNKKPNKNWSDERNVYSDYAQNNFIVDLKKNVVWIATRWTKERSQCCEEKVDTNNRCELDIKTWKMYAFAGSNKYELPFNMWPLKLDRNWKPDGLNSKNRERIKYFARIWNLVNKIKKNAVFNNKWALRYTGWGIQVNNWIVFDTDQVSNQALNELNNKYSHISALWKLERVKLASLLTAMKLDLNKISWEPDIVSWYRLVPNPLDKEHQWYVKSYAKHKSRIGS